MIISDISEVVKLRIVGLSRHLRLLCVWAGIVAAGEATQPGGPDQGDRLAGIG